MSTDQTTYLQKVIARLPDDPCAQLELVGCAYERLRRLARKIYHADFPTLKQIHETGTIVHEAVLRLLQSLEEVQPATVRDFFCFSAVQIRRTLLDLARKHQSARPFQGIGQADADSCESTPSREPDDTTNDPVTLASWSEFHQKVEELPDPEREVVDLHWYQGLSQAETAQLLGIHPKEVSRRWLRARLKLPDWAPS
jgi:RNA polymerase sigma factor (sigma-70 family)